MQEKIKEVDRFLTTIGKRLLSVARVDVSAYTTEIVECFVFSGYSITHNGVNFKYVYISSNDMSVNPNESTYFMSFEDLEKYDI